MINIKLSVGPGSVVKIDDDMTVLVTAVELRRVAGAAMLSVSYECSWWDDRATRTEWFPAWRVQPTDGGAS